MSSPVPTILLMLPGLALVFGSSLDAAEPLLANAVEKQDQAAIRQLLDQGADVQAAQADGMTALHWAVHAKDLNTVQRLLQAGAEVDCRNRYGVTPLSIACVGGEAKLVALLLDKGANPNGALAGGETVLMTAARTGRVEPVRALLTGGANVNARDRRKQTALMWAAAEGHAEVVDALLEAGAEFKQPLDSGFTPMLFAVREGHIAVVQRFLKAGVDVNAVMTPRNSGGRNVDAGTSALILATENGHFELAVELLKAGADPNDQRTGFSPLHIISWVRKPPIGDGIDGEPPPIGSGNISSLQFVRQLVEHGADVNLRLKANAGREKFGRKGTTPFLCAAGTGDALLMRTLLDLKADPTLSNDLGWTPLMMAAGIGTGSSGDSAGTEEECLEAVKLLVESGADVNAIDKNGETAMHGAAYKMLPSVARYLAEQGADVKVWSQPARNGRMPLWIALGYRGGGNFKPSYETAAVFRELMVAQGLTPPPPPQAALEKGYPPN